MSNPRIDDEFGTKEWFNSKDELHREDGPAVEWVNGDACWLLNGKFHRLDGPAIEYAEGKRYFFVDDEEVTEEDYPQAVLLYKCKQVLES